MANIDKYLEEIKEAKYGEEVRDSIVNALTAENDETESATETANKAAETVTESLIMIQESKDAAENAAILSESWAVGGTGTREGENENNAKYYADSIAGDADKAAESAEQAEASAEAAAKSAESCAEHVTLTREEYDALPDTKLTDNVFYFVSDTGEIIHDGVIYGGDEGGEIAKEALAKAEAAQSAADAAQSTADSASAAANTAQSAADAAQSTADSASTAASTAQSAADAAQSTADSAQSAANAAQSSADSAQSAADKAQSTADSANTAASAAQTSADAAQADATEALDLLAYMPHHFRCTPYFNGDGSSSQSVSEGTSNTDGVRIYFPTVSCPDWFITNTSTSGGSGNLKYGVTLSRGRYRFNFQVTESGSSVTQGDWYNLYLLSFDSPTTTLRRSRGGCIGGTATIEYTVTASDIEEGNNYVLFRAAFRESGTVYSDATYAYFSVDYWPLENY